MEITKRALIQELKEKVEATDTEGRSPEAVAEILFDLIKKHVQRGDTMQFQEFSIHRKSSERFVRHASSRSRVRKSRRSTRGGTKFYSSNFFINEFALMLHDASYFWRKVLYFVKYAGLMFVLVVLYYFVTLLVGC